MSSLWIAIVFVMILALGIGLVHFKVRKGEESPKRHGYSKPMSLEAHSTVTQAQPTRFKAVTH